MTRIVSTRAQAHAAALVLAAGLSWFAAPHALAQGQGAADAAKPDAAVPSAGSDDGRYTFHRKGEGFVRLDSRTGQVSQCGWSANSWSCKLVADERTALESEISRLQRDNAALKQSLLSNGIDLPGGMAETPVAQAPIPPGSVPDLSARDPKGPLGPTEADMDRALTFVKNAWRRLVDMMVDLQRDMQRKS